MEKCWQECFHPQTVKRVKAQGLNVEEIKSLAAIYKALGDETRLRLLWALSLEELCVCDLAKVVEMSQSAVSHQLRILRNLKLVKYRREGKRIYYSLDDEHIVNLLAQGVAHIRH
jgi:DNA-binding transcriptional ArsR family regulator